MSSPPSQRKTQPGLGAVDGIPHVDSAERPRVDVKERSASIVTPPPVSVGRVRETLKREDDPEPSQPPPSEPRVERTPTPAPRRTGAFSAIETPSGTIRRPGSRAAVSVDEVGAAAVKIARASSHQQAPKLVASREMIAQAPIDSRHAFVLSLCDGRNTATAIVDMSGMAEEEVKAVLDRLARLGLITLG